MVEIIKCWTGLIFISALIGLMALYSYVTNQHTTLDDPAHNEYDVFSLFLAPLTWPLLLVFGVLFTILKAFFFGVCLLLFTVAAVVFRKPFFWPLLEPRIKKIGNTVLKINTALIRLFTRG